MQKTTAIVIVGGVVIGTVVVAATSVVLWSLIPISIWTMSTAVIGTQTLNVWRVMNAKTEQPTLEAAPELQKKAS